jgi:hypothetical protein
MVLHPKSFPHHLRDALAGLQIRAVSRCRWSGQEHGHQRLSLFFGKTTRSTRMRFGGQSFYPFGQPRTLPTFHAGKIDAQARGDFLQRLPFLEILRTAKTTSVQNYRTA